jgi:hypothetical protein
MLHTPLWQRVYDNTLLLLRQIQWHQPPLTYTECKLYIIQSPAAHPKPEEVVEIVRFVVKDWKEVATS